MNQSPQESQARADRPTVPAIDEILGVRLNVLDDGFVRVIDYMGNDTSIVQAARVSYGEGTKAVHQDRGLIRYLLRHAHTTPFEMCEIKLHVRVPMDTWRQWIRHRTGSVNEYSTRYSVAIDAAQKTPPNEWRLQSGDNRQGSGGFISADEGAALSRRESESQHLAREVYEERLRLGVAREQARKDLPLCTYTEAYWKVDLHNLLHFLLLRMDSHAQQEIRTYARLIGEEIVSRWCPLAWEAFLDYRVETIHLGRLDQRLLSLAAHGEHAQCIREARDEGLISLNNESAIKRARELVELEPKFAQMRIAIPWQDNELTRTVLKEPRA